MWGIPLLFMTLGIPLILQKVPPNALYGVRIPASFKSPEAWYRINYLGGWLLVGVGIVCLVANALIIRIVNKPNNPRELLAMAGFEWLFIVVIGIVMIIIAPKL
jgi:uncharacterized membrane protein